MFTIVEPVGGSVYTPGAAILAGGSAPNPLAFVPWVAQWKFNNNGNDSIGANTLTNNNSATFTTGKLGGATGATQLVAASSQYWSIADNAALSMGDIDFLIVAWVKLTDKSGVYTLVSKGDNSGSNNPVEYQLLYNNVTDRFRFLVGNGSANASVNANTFGSPTAGVWYLVAAWHDATNNVVKISINGGTSDSTSYSGGSLDSSQPLYVGRTEFGFYMNGVVDNVCIAKGTGAVPTQAVLDALYNNGNGTETLT